MSEKDPLYLQGLNPAQRQAVLHFGPPLLILAGAGSGKTRVITVKIAHLLESQALSPLDILAVTFTNKAAAEMQERAIGLSFGAERVLIRTFHSFGAWFLRRNGSEIGLHRNFSIYDEDDTVSLLKTLYPGRERRSLAHYAFLIGRAKDYALSPEDPLSEVSSDPEFPDIYKAYEEKLRRIGNVDFGDLILGCTQVLRQSPEVKARIHHRFKVIMVDEYQDSNVAQHQLLRELASPEAYVCVVGDDDQSIYRFRGAEVRNILGFPEAFPGTEIIRLEQNYRSTGRILAAAGAVVDHNRHRLGKTLWTANEEGPPPQIVSCEDQNQEAAFCLSLIRKNPEPDTAILYRTNAQSRIFETLFLRENQAYRIVGTLRFYEREEIKDALAFLKFIANPRDEVSFRRIINKPPRGLGAVSVTRILDRLDSQGLIPPAMDAAQGDLGGRGARSLKDFRHLYHKLVKILPGESLSSFVETLIWESGLADYHKNQDEVTGTQKLQNLEELVNAATTYSPGMEGLTEFLEAIELDRERIREAEERNDPTTRVTLITMHNTKGLEFDRVIITGMEEGIFPRGGEETEEDIEEERRLFYVAITRARREVYFTHCHNRLIYGKFHRFEPSRFLMELPPEVRGTEDLSPQEENDFPPGTAVYHEDHGPGYVWKRHITEGNLVVVVQFSSGRSLSFLPKYERRLEKIAIDGA